MESTYAINKMIPELEQYALNMLSEEELGEDLSRFRQTTCKMTFMQQKRMVAERVTKSTMLLKALVHEDLN